MQDVFVRARVGLAFGLALAFFMDTITVGLSGMARTEAILTTMVNSNNDKLAAVGEIVAYQQSLNVQAKKMAADDFAQVRRHMIVLGALGALATAIGIASALLTPHSMTRQIASVGSSARHGSGDRAITCAEIAQIENALDACAAHPPPMHAPTLASQGIITLIDGIAFQANILALSVAVEAARSGEQGQSFALVASEVHSLAGRSAIAAKEIKAFVNASAGHSEQSSDRAAQRR